MPYDSAAGPPPFDPAQPGGVPPGERGCHARTHGHPAAGAPDMEPAAAGQDGDIPAGARRFACGNCGASLVFTPGTASVECPYCGTSNEIPDICADGAYLREHDYLEALEREEQKQSDDSPTTEAVHCPACGANTTLSPERTSDRCPYCGSPLATQNHYSIKLNVQALLPFVIPYDGAMAIYRKWVASRWFAPSDFARRATREEALNGVYMPYWTYDANTTTSYLGERGDAYYVTRTVYVVENGKRAPRRQQVRQIRWSPASGAVGVVFDDILVPASGSLPSHLAEQLVPWNLSQLKPFDQGYLSGFVTESYQVGLEEGFQDAKRRMESSIDHAIRRDIGGDEQRVHQKRTNYANVTFKHILLPVWLSAYAYGGRTYRFMVNAQTGSISGDRPWSVWKIALAVAAGIAAAAASVHFLAG
ncbi:MAG: zinc ribbon domain-containing protein [Planctomycetota bacterium]|nr:zinc ribbon domain-containing protein [Planctomycetota bacterium]